MRPARRSVPAALAVALALAAAGAAGAAGPLKELSWSFGARTHFLQVGPPAVAGALPGLELPGKGRVRRGEEPPDSERRLLLSVVGPVVSRYVRTTGGGADGWVTEHLETEWLDGYTFDLRSYLARNARLPQGLEGADFARFAVVDWDGRDALTLEIERKGCEKGRAGCALETARVVAPPPGGWRPWLEASLQGRGLLQCRAAGWWRTEKNDPRAPIR